MMMKQSYFYTKTTTAATTTANPEEINDQHNCTKGMLKGVLRQKKHDPRYSMKVQEARRSNGKDKSKQKLTMKNKNNSSFGRFS